ncbi:MAG: TNT domain-containing protein [Pseudomonadota bacterium]
MDENGVFKDFGSFVAPESVPYQMRALPLGTDLRPLSTYEVVKPIYGVPSGPAASYFGEIGQGTQHQLPMTIQDYLDQGIIRLIERKIPTKPQAHMT